MDASNVGSGSKPRAATHTQSSLGRPSRCETRGKQARAGNGSQEKAKKKQGVLARKAPEPRFFFFSFGVRRAAAAVGRCLARKGTERILQISSCLPFSCISIRVRGSGYTPLTPWLELTRKLHDQFDEAWVCRLSERRRLLAPIRADRSTAPRRRRRGRRG